MKKPKPKRSSRRLGLAYLYEERNRHGSPRVIVRRNARRIQIHEAFDERPGALQTPEFLRAYASALEGVAVPAAPKAEKPSEKEPKPGTLGALAKLYFESAEFKALAIKSQMARRGVIESCLREVNKTETFRDCPLEKFTQLKVRALREKKRAFPAAANIRRKCISAMFSWAIEAGKFTGPNPARDVKRVQYATDGFHTWTVDEVLQYREHHAIGTKARLALELLLLLGVRRSDMVKLGKQFETKDGAKLRFVVQKTKWRKARTTLKPILPQLRAVIDKSPTGDLNYLVTEYGKPFTANGVGNKIRQWCDDAGLGHCSAHGLRKAGATIAANNGATVNQLMAIYDWESAAQAMTYTRQADRDRLTDEAMPLLAGK